MGEGSWSAPTPEIKVVPISRRYIGQTFEHLASWWSRDGVGLSTGVQTEKVKRPAKSTVSTPWQMISRPISTS